MDILNPSTGETIAQVPAGTAEDVDAAVETAKRALPDWLDTTPGEARGGAAEGRRPPRDGTPRSWRGSSRRTSGKPLAYARDEIPVCVDKPAFLRGRRASPRRQERGRVHARLHVDDPPRAARRRRRIAPWNYPLMMAVWKLAPR